MNPQRAILVLEDILDKVEVYDLSIPNYYGGAWVIYARTWDRQTGEFKRPLTQFAEPFSSARWLQEFETLRAEELRKRAAEAFRASLKGKDRPEVEKVARALYVASGGSEEEYPWPCKGADHYRHLARVALDTADAD
jgi:hypothetical protein